MKARFVLQNVGPSNRYKLHLENPEGQTIFIGQYRSQKPLTHDEMKLARIEGVKDNSFERIHTDKWMYMLRARDRHELGRGHEWDTQEEMESEIVQVRKYIAEADYIDETPDDERVRTREAIAEAVEEHTQMLIETGVLRVEDTCSQSAS